MGIRGAAFNENLIETDINEMFDLKPYILLLGGKRWFLLVNFILVSAFSIVMAFYIATPEYSSAATFLPPFNTGSMMAIGSNPLASMLGGDDSGDNIESVFESKAFKRKIIDKFNLIEYYKLDKGPNQFELAVKKMQENQQVELTSVLKGKGIGVSKTASYSVQTYHRSPDTALLMSEFVFACLDSAMVDISINKAKRNREFVEEQYRASQEKLDSLQEEFKDFQIAHKAFDVSEQMRLTLKVYADVKAAAVMNDLKLMTLRRQFREDSPEIVEALNAKRSFDSKLAEMEKRNEYDVVPSLNLSSELMPKYTNIRRALEVQNQINLLLVRELEQARLQESRDVSPLVLIDPPYKADYKARPKRVTMVVSNVAGYMFFLIFIIIAYWLVKEHFIPWFKTENVIKGTAGDRG